MANGKKRPSKRAKALKKILAESKEELDTANAAPTNTVDPTFRAPTTSAKTGPAHRLRPRKKQA
jgi:hypothetical protein